MWRRDSTRVACLWLPRFPIVVALPPEYAPGHPAALIQGEGTHGRLIHVNHAGHELGLRDGWRLPRARALVPQGLWIPWDTEIEQRLMEVTRRLSQALNQVSPRLDASGHGCFWLEPFSLRSAPDQASGEAGFARRVREVIREEGFSDARVGVATGVITAHAAARYAPAPGLRVEAGQETAFLGQLPCSALPMSPRMLSLLEGVGVSQISALQRIARGSLIARFGREGEKIYDLARGRDSRGPRTPEIEEPTRVHVPLAAPCQTIEPLLFVIRGALDRLVSAQVERGQAVARVRIHMHREEDRPDSSPDELWVIEISPSRPTTQPRLLLELLRVAFSDRFKGDQGDLCGFVEALTIELPERALAMTLQGDLFVERAQDPAIFERVLLRLTHRLGVQAVRRPERVETRHPDRGGRWRVLEQISDRVSRITELQRGACYRRLENPLPVTRAAPDRLDLQCLGESEVRVSAWRGEERRAGQWWSQSYDRDYVWAELEDGRMYRLYRSRESQQWYVEGWID
jgi:nucleotidyltransferase/DNA polymerase involved in DNA repair